MYNSNSMYVTNIYFHGKNEKLTIFCSYFVHQRIFSYVPSNFLNIKFLYRQNEEYMTSEVDQDFFAEVYDA